MTSSTDHDDRNREVAVSASPGQGWAEAFVDLSDTLVAEFDIVEFLHVLAGRCVELLNVRVAGIMVGNQRGALRVMASSSEQAHLLELVEAATAEGPCVDCYRTGRAVDDPDLATPDRRWTRFAAQAKAAGFGAVHAVPVRLRAETIGVLILFSVHPGLLGPADAQAARALANVTTLGLLQHRDVEYRQVLAEQVQNAMNSRVVLEQAKGVLAEYLGLDMAGAFDELRRLATRLGQRLGDVAAAVTAGDYDDPATAGGRLRMLLIRRFELATLTALRGGVHAALIRHGLPAPAAAKFVLAVHEAAANAVVHGGGAGQFLLWRRNGDVYAEVSDHGAGLPGDFREAAERPARAAEDPRGLWLINSICTALDIETGPGGTRLLLRYPLGSPDLSGPPAGR
ncbi:ANTAR domain-containing protein [Actinoplanes oblitus]|uniref:ANTAR domain-containing protein n=1 Tax=Actinoplanes oblitus TaxID=3040509 RepID=A0ABY8WN92_9ACTN|nr:ANTAR domain-containing protein [Actinoplanes oblitus]WIM99349.1 ANTAR domain-containing protein [Actinoplanes oblitus]